MRVCEVGEKRLIAELIRPMFNPRNNPDSVGDDCAIITVGQNAAVCMSTDRVPADLTAYRLGLIDTHQLGYYLAVLNISDLAAAGASPRGMLLNLGLPNAFLVGDLKALLEGVAEAATEYSCPVLGGDLSDSVELNLVATAIGALDGDARLYRSGARAGDLVFCCDVVGITPTAFAHYTHEARSPIGVDAEETLCSHFTRPKARTGLGSLLRSSRACSSAMDNTDGLGQTLLELASASSVAIEIDETLLPVSAISSAVASASAKELFSLVMEPGADFQLVGTARPSAAGYKSIEPHIHIIGTVLTGEGVWRRNAQGDTAQFNVRGWNYYTTRD